MRGVAWGRCASKSRSYADWHRWSGAKSLRHSPRHNRSTSPCTTCSTAPRTPPAYPSTSASMEARRDIISSTPAPRCSMQSSIRRHGAPSIPHTLRAHPFPAFQRQRRRALLFGKPLPWLSGEYPADPDAQVFMNTTQRRRTRHRLQHSTPPLPRDQRPAFRSTRPTAIPIPAYTTSSRSIFPTRPT